jgi:hypothetical protein
MAERAEAHFVRARLTFYELGKISGQLVERLVDGPHPVLDSL